MLGSSGGALSIETLLDILLVLYDECQTPALRREKRISEFIDFGKKIILKIHLAWEKISFTFKKPEAHGNPVIV